MLLALLPADARDERAALIPPYPAAQPPEAAAAEREQQWREGVMRCFFTAVALDVLECVKAAVASAAPPQQVEQLLGKLTQRAQAVGAAAALRLLLPPSARPGGEPDPWPRLCDQLQSPELLGRPPLLGPAVQRALESQGLGAKLAAGAPFRPPKFQLAVAQRAVEFVLALAALPTPAPPAPVTAAHGEDEGEGAAAAEALPAPPPGAAWAMALFPALHYLLLGAFKALPKELTGLYLPLRQRLEEQLGPAALRTYPTSQTRKRPQPGQGQPQSQGEGQARPPLAPRSQQQQQPQQQQQVPAASCASVPGPPLRQQQQPQPGSDPRSAERSGQEATSGSGSGGVARGQVYANDQPLSRLPSLGPGCELPLLAVLDSRPMQKQVRRLGREGRLH